MALSVDARKLYRHLSMVAFLLLFPGFFVYHYLVARSYLPPFLGGFFGVVAAVLFIPLLALYFKTKVGGLDRVSILFFLLILLNLTISVLNYWYGELYGLADEMLVWSLSGILFNLVAYLISYSLDVRRLIKYLVPSFLLMVLVVVFNVGDLGIFYIKQEAGEAAESVATYQGFARSLVAVSLIVTAYYWRSSAFFYFFAATGLLALFLNGARTEFALFLVTLLSALILFFSKSYKSIVEVLFFILIGAFAYIFGSDMLPESRMFQLLDIGSSSSAESRALLLDNGLKIIYENPILGGYGEYVQLGGIGSYPHNIISAWVNLGAIGILGYASMFIAMWFVFLKNRTAHKNMIEFKVFLFFLTYISMALLFSKDYSYLFVGFLVGIYSRYRQNVCTKIP